MASSLEEELVCPICLALFQEPRMLRCGHNFCLACLRGAVAAGQEEGSCPECRSPFHLQELQRNRALGNLARKVRRWRGDAPEPLLPPGSLPAAWHFCEAHDEPLKLFCTQDEAPICVICRDLPEHRGHHFLPTQNAAQAAQRKLKAYLKLLEEFLKRQTKDETDQQKEIATLKNFTGDLLDHISTEFEILYQILHKKEEDIKGLVEKIKERDMKDMDDYLISLKEDIYSQTETIVKVKASLEEADHVVFLKGFKELMERVKKHHPGVEDYIDDEEGENSKDKNKNSNEEDENSNEESENSKTDENSNEGEKSEDEDENNDEESENSKTDENSDEDENSEDEVERDEDENSEAENSDENSKDDENSNEEDENSEDDENSNEEDKNSNEDENSKDDENSDEDENSEDEDERDEDENSKDDENSEDENSDENSEDDENSNEDENSKDDENSDEDENERDEDENSEDEDERDEDENSDENSKDDENSNEDENSEDDKNSEDENSDEDDEISDAYLIDSGVISVAKDLKILKDCLHFENWKKQLECIIPTKELIQKFPAD
ncbi:protein starmaker-like [Sphaerodactylus townsendi]|uniref:protein starmaker-like n=1 Tax=Sphaerodactylus townsendi TaxID=933632 RepID=UPI0020268491|nr:protein starmaker-like [Sphaerodactylus townsendi]